MNPFCFAKHIYVDNVIRFGAFKHINKNENQYVVSENILAARQIKNNEGTTQKNTKKKKDGKKKLE